MREFCVGVRKALQTQTFALPPNANPNIRVTPQREPQHEQVQYRLCWVPSHWGSRWPCTFHVLCVNIICVALCWVANTNAFSSGKWAQESVPPPFPMGSHLGQPLTFASVLLLLQTSPFTSYGTAGSHVKCHSYASS